MKPLYNATQNSLRGLADGLKGEPSARKLRKVCRKCRAQRQRAWRGNRLQRLLPRAVLQAGSLKALPRERTARTARSRRAILTAGFTESPPLGRRRS